MRSKTFLVFCLILLAGLVSARSIFESFEDGDITTNPTWGTGIGTCATGVNSVQGTTVLNGSKAWKLAHTGSCDNYVIYLASDFNSASFWVNANGNAAPFMGISDGGLFFPNGATVNFNPGTSTKFTFSYNASATTGTFQPIVDTWYRIQVDVNQNGGRARIFSTENVLLDQIFKNGVIGNPVFVFVGESGTPAGTGNSYYDLLEKDFDSNYSASISFTNYGVFDSNNFVNDLNYFYLYRCKLTPDFNAPFNFQINDINTISNTLNCDNVDRNISGVYSHPTQDVKYNFKGRVFLQDANQNLNVADKNFYTDFNAPIKTFSYTTVNGFTTDSNITVSLTCSDVHPALYDYNTINYQLLTNGSSSLNSDLNNNTVKKVYPSVSNGSNTFISTCKDLANNISQDSNTVTFYVNRFNLINEVTGAAFDLSLVNALTARSYDLNQTYNLKTLGLNTFSFYQTKEDTIRFDINYSDNSTKLWKEFSLSLLDTNTNVCVSPLQTFYEMLLTSTSRKGVTVYNSFAKCYAMADYTKYGTGNALNNTAWTFASNYIVTSITPITLVRLVVSLADGSKVANLNLDLLELNLNKSVLTNLSDEATFQKLTSTTTAIYYNNVSANNTKIVFDIYNGSTKLFTQTETANPNKFTLVFDYNGLAIDQNTLKLVITKTLSDGTTGTITRYFTTSGTVGSLKPGFGLILGLIVLIVGLTIVLPRLSLGWWGLLVAFGALYIFSQTASAWYITMFMGITAIIAMYIGLTFRENLGSAN